MAQFISSGKNSHIKETGALSKKKGREAAGLFIVEGIRAVEDALDSGAIVEKIFLTEDLYANALFSGISGNVEDKHVFVVPGHVFDKISDTRSPQGILAVVKQNDREFKQFAFKDEFILLLENIQDPGNLGTIIRTADAAGADMVILGDNCVDLYNTKVVRSTMSALFHVPVCKVSDSLECLKKLKENGYISYAACPDTEISCYNTDYSGKICLMFGNEAKGLSERLVSHADVRVKIPMYGKAESLNVSVAAGILMYERVRKK